MKRAIALILSAAFLFLSASFVTIAEDKTNYLDSIDHDANSGIVAVEEGYSPEDKYIVFSGRLKAKSPVDHSGWKNTIYLGLSGTDAAWENHTFLLVYGTTDTQNLVKLNDGRAGTFNNSNVPQEQWYNNAKLEKLFADEGIAFKLVRVNTWAYLLADMGDGYELIGRMALPEDAPTEFTLDNANTSLRLSRFKIETGKESALAALNDFNVTSANWGTEEVRYDSYYFAVNSTEWSFEAKITLPDYASYAGLDRRTVMVGPLNSAKHHAVFKGANNDWYMQSTEDWSGSLIGQNYVEKLDPANGGLWVKWIRKENYMTSWISLDGERWEYSHSMNTVAPGASGIYLDSEWNAVLKDIKITTNGDTPENVYLPNQSVFSEGNYKSTPINPSTSLENERWAVMTAHIQTNTPMVHNWSKNFIPSVSGTGNPFNFYGFQMVYGEHSAQNLVKLTDGKQGVINIRDDYPDWLRDTAPQEQWYNNTKFEKLYSAEGMDIKMVRLDYVAYLFADMGDGWEMIGRMYIPQNQSTQFSLSSFQSDVNASNIKLETGKHAATAAMDGVQFSIGADSKHLFEVGERQWVVDTQINLPATGTGDRHCTFSVMLPIWERAVRVKWLQGEGIWAVVFDGPEGGEAINHKLPAADSNGKIWLRWVRDHNKYSVYAGTDGISYTLMGSVSNYNDILSGGSVIDPFLIKTWEMGNAVNNFRVRVGADAIATVDMKSIAVTTQPTRTAYIEGESFNAAGMVLTLTKQDNSTLNVPLAECEFTPLGKLTTYDEQITVSYKGFSAVVPITVAEKSVKKVEMKDLPYISEYEIGGKFDALGASYLVTYDNGDVDEFDITTEMCSAVNTSDGGLKVVKLSVEHQGEKYDLSFKINVKTIDKPTEPGEDNGDNKEPATGELFPYIALSVFAVAISGLLLVTLMKRKNS